MGILSWILDNLGGYVLGKVLDKVFEDKAKDMEEAFDNAYNTWYVTHRSTDIRKQDYERLKPRLIGSLCHKDFHYDSEEEEGLFKEWYNLIDKGTDAHDELQTEISKCVISDLGTFKSQQLQVNQEMITMLIDLTEKVITISNQSEKIDTLEKGVNEIKDLIAINGLNVPLYAKKYQQVKGYVDRYVVSEKEKNNFVRFLLKQKPQTLFDMISSAKDGENKFLLVDKGQSGKTTELKELGYKLSEDGRYFPLFYEPYDSSSFSKKDLPVGDIYDDKIIAILIDAADEFKQDDRSRFFNIISDYAEEHPHTIIVISCRNNYEELESLRKDNVFIELSFEDLTTDQWKDMIRMKAGNKADELISLIIDKGLLEYMTTPFEIAVITDYYLDKGKLLTTRADIYRQFIYSKLEQDDRKNLNDGKHLKYDILPYLERIAVVMQSYGHDFVLTYPQMLKCLDNNEDIAELIKRSDLIIPIGKDQYKFSENAYREYLAADYLSNQDFSTILSFIKYDHGDLMRQQWANVSLILLSILYNNDKNKYALLFDWMVKYQPDFVLFLERNTVEKKVREAIFRNLLEHYRKQKRLIAPANHQTIKRIMEFAQSTETVEFLMREVLKTKDNNKENNYLENLYAFLEYADFSDLALYNKQEIIDNFTNFVYHLISKYKESTEEKAFVMYFPLNNPYYHDGDTYVKRLIKTVGDTHNRYAVDAVISLVCFTNLYDEFADYVIEHESDIHDYQDKRGITVSVLRFAVNKALESVTERDNILKVLSHLCTRDFLLQNHYRDSDTLDIVKALLQTAKTNNTFANDIEGLHELLKAYTGLMTNSLFSRPAELFIAIRDFFTDTQLADKIYNEALDCLRKNLRVYDFDRLRKCLYVFYLFLSKERVDSLIDTMNPSDNDDYALITNIAYEVPDKTLGEYLKERIDEKFGRRIRVRDWEAEKKKSVMQLFDYDRFRKAVLEAAGKYPKAHKDLRNHTIPWDENTDQYVCAFFYMTSKEPYDLEKIKTKIEGKEYYNRFLLYIVYQNRSEKEFQNQLTESLRSKLISAAEENILLDKSYTFISEASLFLLINGKLNLHYEQVEKLLTISNYALGEQNLFDYIAKLAKKRRETEETLIAYYTAS